MNRICFGVALAGALALAGASACAHVVLDRGAAPAGSYFRADFRLGHGCDGSSTTSVTVFVPKGVLVAKPQPKPGWAVQIHTAPLAVPAKLHGREQRDAVERVRWTGGPLPDDQFDDFALLVRLPDTPGKLEFRVLQQCESGQIDWAEPAGSGKERIRRPMPSLRVLPAEGSGHRH